MVGIVLAMAVTGPLNDWGIVWISKRNRGIYEPEFRLVFMASMLFGVFGYVGWAVGNDHHMPWIGAVGCITCVFRKIILSTTAHLICVTKNAEFQHRRLRLGLGDVSP